MFTNIIQQFDIIIRQFGGFLTQFSVVFLNFRFAILWIPIFPTNKLWKFKDAGPANLLKQSLNTVLGKSYFSKCRGRILGVFQNPYKIKDFVKNLLNKFSIFIYDGNPF